MYVRNRASGEFNSISFKNDTLSAFHKSIYFKVTHGEKPDVHRFQTAELDDGVQVDEDTWHRSYIKSYTHTKEEALEIMKQENSDLYSRALSNHDNEFMCYQTNLLIQQDEALKTKLNDWFNNDIKTHYLNIRNEKKRVSDVLDSAETIDEISEAVFDENNFEKSLQEVKVSFDTISI